MRYFLKGYLILALLFPAISFGQERERRDSLERLLQEEISDSGRTRVLMDLATEYRYVDTIRFGQYMDRAMELAQDLEDKRYIGRYYEIRGETEMHFGHYEKALISFDRALAFYNESNDNNAYYQTLKDKGNIHLFRGEYELALNYYETALDYYRRKGNGQGASRCLNNMGIIYKNRGQYVDALSAYDESIKIIDAEAQPLQVAQGYINMGNVFVFLGSYEHALEYFETALELSEKSGSIKETALCLLNTGVVQNKCGSYREANDFYTRALDMGREIGDPVIISNSLINIGTNLGQMGKAREGLTYVEQGHEIKKELGDRRTMSNCLIYLADLHIQLGNFTEAKNLLDEALPEKTELKDLEGQIRCYLGLAHLAKENGAYSRSNALSDQALEIASQIQALEHEAAAIAIKRDIAEKRGDYHSAFNYALEYNSINDSLLNEATSKAVMEMEFRHRSKVLEKENENLRIQGGLNTQLMKKRAAFMHSMIGIVIILLAGLLVVGWLLRRLKNSSLKLEEKNLVITRQNLRLDEMNQNKDRMMSIIAHDLRGTMGNQITAIDVLRRIEGIEEPDIDRRKLLANLKLSATYSLELLENLLLWSRLEETEEYFKPEMLDMNTVVTGCVAMVEEMAAKKAIELNMEIPVGMKIQADRIMLETIVRNLLSNALKFSHPEGYVQITAHENDCGIELMVSDRGIGMSEEEIQKLLRNGGFSRRGTDNEKGAGIGMTLVRELTELHRGELHIDSQTGKGTSVRICFPPKS